MYALSSIRKIGKFQFSCQTFVDHTQKWSTLSIENLSTKIFVLWTLGRLFSVSEVWTLRETWHFFTNLNQAYYTILPCMIVTRVKLGKDMVLYFYDTRLKCLKFGHARINGLRRLFFFSCFWETMTKCCGQKLK